MKRIFILDDNEELLEIVTRLLKKEFEIISSADTENIIVRITAFDPDVLILDHSIGELNSTEIIARLKVHSPAFNKPVILFSAHPQLADIAAVVGADGYIDKPSDISHIRNYIRGVLGTTPGEDS